MEGSAPVPNNDCSPTNISHGFQMEKSRYWMHALVLGCAGILVSLLCGCSNSVPPVPPAITVDADHETFAFSRQSDNTQTEFRIDWPPQVPGDATRIRTPPLLNGTLLLTAGTDSGKQKLNVRIELSRPRSESDRNRWNRALQFPEYDWMSRVRTWDRDKKWLWPNLPFLLRANGVPRHQRYGGVDPGKGVDNDFAGIVVKHSGINETESVLVAVDWHPPVGEPVDKRSIVPSAISDDLQLTLPDTVENGEVSVWLIYADFLNFQPPKSWPEEPEYDGGILSYFGVKWRRTTNGKIKITDVKNVVPPKSTGVNWKQWLSENQEGG